MVGRRRGNSFPGQRDHFGSTRTFLQYEDNIHLIPTGAELVMQVALASIRQRPLDISGNCEKIKQCIHEAVRLGAGMWIGADWELLGYWPEPLTLEEPIGDQINTALLDIAKEFAEIPIIVIVRVPHGHKRNNSVCIVRGKISLTQDVHVDLLSLSQIQKSILTCCDDKSANCMYTSILGTDGESIVFSGGLKVWRGGSLVCRSDTYSLNDYQVLIYPPDDPAPNIKPHDHEEERVRMITSWMYDKLMESGQTGFFVPLSGGIDSALTALLVKRLMERMKNEFGKEVSMSSFLHTAYLSARYSSEQSREMAKRIAEHLQCTLTEFDMNPIIENLPKLAQSEAPIQNATARLRLVLSYYLAQSAGNLLVIGTGNRDEIMTGYYTKYDCSSGDIAPIADLSKPMVRSMVKYLLKEENPKLAHDLIDQRPTAELGENQFDESELGMTFEEMSKFFDQLYDTGSTNANYLARFKQNIHKIKTLPVHCRCTKRSFADLLYSSNRGPI